MESAGIAKGGGNRCVRVVSDDHAAEVRTGLSELLSEQIYSLTPSAKAPDAASLITADIEQARSMMASLLSNKASDQVSLPSYISFVHHPPFCPCRTARVNAEFMYQSTFTAWIRGVA